MAPIRPTLAQIRMVLNKLLEESMDQVDLSGVISKRSVLTFRRYFYILNSSLRNKNKSKIAGKLERESK